MEETRHEFERLIHSELRLIRQRAELVQPSRASVSPILSPQSLVPAFDYAAFAERFRGSEEYVKAAQQIYVPYFAGRRNVLDIGCGRGEFLELMRDAGVEARGIDLSAESVALCRSKGLEAESADVFSYLSSQPEAVLGGIFCAQVIEHLPPERLPELIKLAAGCLEPGGVIAIETPNPECLAIFATHFYLDPTHTRPVPYPLLVFYLEEFGIGGIEVKKLSPALDSMPSVRSLTEEFRESFFDGLDYCVIGKSL
jgi:2-polyprenyl-3-methyl-5-hydroxy-6-metoxy-1,4-benzoquinol methylase